MISTNYDRKSGTVFFLQGFGITREELGKKVRSEIQNKSRIKSIKKTKEKYERHEREKRIL